MLREIELEHSEKLKREEEGSESELTKSKQCGSSSSRCGCREGISACPLVADRE